MGVGFGHEDAFPRPRLSARCWFSQGTFAGTWGNGRDARFLTFPPLPRNGRFDRFRTVASARMKSGRLQPPDPRTFRSDALRHPAHFWSAEI